MAPVYDAFTVGYQAATWTGKLLGLAQRHGAPERGHLLDVGCGTGKSFLPMLERGWTVAGCDLSPTMVDLAAGKVGEDVRLEVADMRDLPDFGAFDLVWALNDAVNNLLAEEELEAALAGMKRNLAPGGIVLFDVNTLSLCRAIATEDEVREVDGRQMKWTALSEGFEAGGICEARFEVVEEPAATHVHSQRHFPERQVVEGVKRAGLELLEVWGDYEGVQDQPLDEERHQKAVYIAR
jgi:SAM-dependent methyltransferase